MQRPSGALLLVICLLAFGCLGSIGDPSSDPAPPSRGEVIQDPREATCDPLTVSASGELRRLSTEEYVASMRALFPEAAVEAVGVWLDALPPDVTNHSPGEFEGGTTEGQIDASFEVAMRIAGLVAGDDTLLATVGGACMLDTEPSAGCVDEFLRDTGRRILRRPLEEDERAAYAATYHHEVAADAREAVEMTLAAMLVAPEFLFHVRGVQADGTLTAHALAARLSFAATGAPADDLLMASADAGLLFDVAERESQVRRLFESPAGRRHVRALFQRWLGLHGRFSPEQAARLAEVPIDGLYDEMQVEALDFVEHVVFEERGAFSDLMTSKAVFPRTERLAAILGTEVSEGVVETEGERAGLLTRPAALISDNPRTSPIRRGLFVWERFLCQVFSLPEDVDVDAAAQENLRAIDPDRATSRERTETMTGTPDCAVCHQSINPPGFALARFGPLGEEWENERVFAEPGEELVRLPLEGDDQVSLALGDSLIDIEGAPGLGRMLVASERGRSCAATQIFRATHLRDPQDADACQLQRLIQAFDDDVPILDLLVHDAAMESTLVSGETP